MQERYLGDIHDFYKFNFLYFLSRSLNTKIGLNWYLVDPKKISQNEFLKHDGEKRGYLKNSSKEFICNKELTKELHQFKEQQKRNIKEFTNKTYLNKFILFFNKELNLQNRDAWFNDSLKYFKQNTFIFLDPDNGLTKSKSLGKNSIKFVKINELVKYQLEKKIIIFTQFQSFNKKHREYLKELIFYLKHNMIEIEFPIIRNRTSPNTFFITIVGNKNNYNLADIYHQYSKINDKVEILPISSLI